MQIFEIKKFINSMKAIYLLFMLSSENHFNFYTQQFKVTDKITMKLYELSCSSKEKVLKTDIKLEKLK